MRACSIDAAALRGAASPIALAAALAVTLSSGSVASADAIAEAGPTKVEEIVVTATKRPELSKDVPIALTVFGENELAKRQANDLAALGVAMRTSRSTPAAVSC